MAGFSHKPSRIISQDMGMTRLAWKSQFGMRGRGEESEVLCFTLWFCSSYLLGYALKIF